METCLPLSSVATDEAMLIANGYTWPSTFTVEAETSSQALQLYGVLGFIVQWFWEASFGTEMFWPLLFPSCWTWEILVSKLMALY